MSRSLKRAALPAALVLAVTGCGIPGLPGLRGGGESSAGPTVTAKPTIGVPSGPRVQPRHPVLMRLGGRLPRTQDISSGEGAIDFDQEPINYRLGYMIRPVLLANRSGLAEVKQVFAEAKVRPEPFVAGDARGHVGEIRVENPFNNPMPGVMGGVFNSGTFRIYAVARPGSEITVFLVVEAPQGKAITPAHRKRADQLMASVAIDESQTDARPRGRTITPVAPFTYVRPPGLTGGEKIKDPELTLSLDAGQGGITDTGVNLRLSPFDDPFSAPEVFRRFHRDRQAEAGKGFYDMKDIPRVRVPEWIDAGYLITSRKQGKPPIDSYMFRANWWRIEVNTFYPANRQAMRDLIESLRPGAYGYIT